MCARNSFEQTTSACSGKCSGECHSRNKLWVVAACSGLIALLSKQADGTLHPLENAPASATPSSAFAQQIKAAHDLQQFDQLVLVGSPSDLAWVQSLLPPEAQSRVMAEIQYPLLPDWLRQSSAQPALINALSQVFRA